MWNWNGIDSRGGTRHILAQARVIAHHSGPLDATWKLVLNPLGQCLGRILERCIQPGAISTFN